MEVRKWVDMGQEVKIDIGIEDVRCALAECFTEITTDRLGEEGPSVAEVLRTFACIGQFLKALSDEQIAALNDAQRKIVRAFLMEQAKRYEGSRVATETASNKS